MSHCVHCVEHSRTCSQLPLRTSSAAYVFCCGYATPQTAPSPFPLAEARLPRNTQRAVYLPRAAKLRSLPGFLTHLLQAMPPNSTLIVEAWLRSASLPLSHPCELVCLRSISDPLAMLTEPWHRVEIKLRRKTSAKTPETPSLYQPTSMDSSLLALTSMTRLNCDAICRFSNASSQPSLTHEMHRL